MFGGIAILGTFLLEWQERRERYVYCQAAPLNSDDNRSLSRYKLPETAIPSDTELLPDAETGKEGANGDKLDRKLTDV